jgi:hypothetical protein
VDRGGVLSLRSPPRGPPPRQRQSARVLLCSASVRRRRQTHHPHPVRAPRAEATWNVGRLGGRRPGPAGSRRVSRRCTGDPGVPDSSPAGRKRPDRSTQRDIDRHRVRPVAIGRLYPSRRTGLDLLDLRPALHRPHPAGPVGNPHGSPPPATHDLQDEPVSRRVMASHPPALSAVCHLFSASQRPGR